MIDSNDNLATCGFFILKLLCQLKKSTFCITLTGILYKLYKLGLDGIF